MKFYTSLLHKSIDSIDRSAPADAKAEFRQHRRLYSPEVVKRRGRAVHALRASNPLSGILRHMALTALCAFALSNPSQAQQADAAPDAAEPATRIAVDEEAGIIRFFIDGEEKARLDAAGLHVSGNITYSGTVRDIGELPTAEPKGGRDADE